jgi:large subunit ribosomal protein L18
VFKPFSARTARHRRHARIRKRLQGTGQRPRLAVFRSLNHVYAQVIDDARGTTLAAASTLDAELRGVKGSGVERARAVGAAIGQRAKAAGVTQVVFDRAGYLYHGRVKALAEAAREAGLEF